MRNHPWYTRSMSKNTDQPDKKKLSLKPLDFEEAIKGLLETESPPKDKAEKEKRQRRKKDQREADEQPESE